MKIEAVNMFVVYNTDTFDSIDFGFCNLNPAVDLAQTLMIFTNTATNPVKNIISHSIEVIQSITHL